VGWVHAHRPAAAPSGSAALDFAEGPAATPSWPFALNEGRLWRARERRRAGPGDDGTGLLGGGADPDTSPTHAVKDWSTGSDSPRAADAS